MTAPVLESNNSFSFIMPSNYTIETLPISLNSQIKMMVIFNYN